MEIAPLTLDQCAYSMENERVMISIGKIANHRDPGDISGTLSVELWALDGPYSGGTFGGIPLAGTTIGEMLGQHLLTDCRYDLMFQQPPAGTWYLSLMLREWTAEGYLTRDYVNFALPFVAGTRPVIYTESGNAVSAQVASDKNGPPAPAEIGDRARPADAAPTETSTTSGKDPEPDQGVSLNSAGRKPISAVQGVPEKAVENIVAERPLGSVDELPVKGMGAKLLHRVRRLFRL